MVHKSQTALPVRTHTHTHTQLTHIHRTDATHRYYACTQTPNTYTSHACAHTQMHTEKNTKTHHIVHTHKLLFRVTYTTETVLGQSLLPTLTKPDPLHIRQNCQQLLTPHGPFLLLSAAMDRPLLRQHHKRPHTRTKPWKGPKRIPPSYTTVFVWLFTGEEQSHGSKLVPDRSKAHSCGYCIRTATIKSSEKRRVCPGYSLYAEFLGLPSTGLQPCTH